MSRNSVLAAPASQQSTAGLGALLDRVVASVDWQSQVRYDTRERWFAPLAVDDLTDHVALEAWLLSWVPGQRTGLHDHGGSAGAFAVVRGVLSEATIQTPAGAAPRLRHQTFRAGQRRPFGPRHLHE